MAEGLLTQPKIVKLSDIITPNKMEEIAQLHLEMEYEEVEGLKQQHSADLKKFVREVLQKWKNKNPGSAQVQKLCEKLHAAGKDALVDPDKVDDILGKLPLVNSMSGDTNSNNNHQLGGATGGAMATPGVSPDTVDGFPPPVPGKGLNYAMQVEVMKYFHNQTDLRTFGGKVGVETNTLEAILYDKERHILEAGHEVMREWRKQTASDEEAYLVLHKVLKDMGRRDIIARVLCA